MGSAESVRATHFQRPKGSSDNEPSDNSSRPEEHHISISNKMVERLVEDATLAGGAAAARVRDIPRDDAKNKTYNEKLKSLDDVHSERYGLTEEELKAMIARVELRTVHMVSPEPICGALRQKVIDCYIEHSGEGELKCRECIAELHRCVEANTENRMKSREAREAKAAAIRDLQLARAKESTLKDIGTPDRQ